MSLHPHTLSWFWANQSLFLYSYNDSCLVVGSTLQGLEPMINFTQGGHANHDITDAAQCHIEITLDTAILYMYMFKPLSYHHLLWILFDEYTEKQLRMNKYQFSSRKTQPVYLNSSKLFAEYWPPSPWFKGP